ncbi:lysoplasmalogenase [uncultured Streptomyces sp.]|uniref:lysoplasmalogenase n=1 Tax=uncultured Streptomyces sp. TaxID=174707 RepID=UPI00262AA57F|nr:lysoplasmalogenase [uncultured Streptomyces sp.]
MSLRPAADRPAAGRPRARAARALLTAFLLVSLVDLLGVLVPVEGAHLVAKPLLMPLLAGYAVARRAPRLLVAALCFGWGGDLLLLADDDLAFLVGMASFAAGHVCYLLLFGRRPVSRAAGAGYAVVLALFLAALFGDLPTGLRAPMAGYGLLLAAMAWRSGALGPYAAAGGALFLLSDGLIAVGVAGWTPPPAHDFLVMLTYLAAQFLLVTGALRTPRGSSAVRPAYGEGRTSI